MIKFNWGTRACGTLLLRAGVVIALSAQTTAIHAPAQTLKTLVNFNGSNGGGPDTMALVQGTDGDLYGTTNTGGTQGYGTIFRMTPTGALRTLYNFCSQSNCTDGASPYQGLILATDGNFYGATTWGGTNGWGTVFKITSGGKLTILHSMEAADGFYPLAPLVQASDGNFYGTVSTGGTNPNGGVFKITPQGVLTTLHSFGGTDGSDPSDALIQGSDGNLYGTTFAGGTSSACESGCGTVFKITLEEKLTTLHSFDLTNGAYPYAKLVQASDGNFYGTTNGGGTSDWGTVFRITPGGTLTTLHVFDGSDGGRAYAGLVQAAGGKLYGTTRYGGSDDVGIIFEITPAGVFKALQSFSGANGEDPSGGLFQATSGIFYGSAWGGGADGDGTIFSENAGLGPFVAALPRSGEEGGAVTILGTSLTGSTSVTFNGAAATFTVKSKSEITTTVPAGATTGTVQVVTPGGTLSSNVPFTVN
jgi:uncharacterized repeat protein (TIGR03803 family)